MSKNEFEKQDEQVIGMVNHTAGTDAREGMKNPRTADTEAAYNQRRILLTVIQVLSCILVAAILVAALMDPEVVVHLVNVGVLTCGVVAGITIDRQLRGR